MGTRYKEAEPLTSNTAKKLLQPLKNYTVDIGNTPKLLQADTGREFISAVTQLIKKHSVRIRKGRTEIHRDLGVVERFSRRLRDCWLSICKRNRKSTKRNRAWVKRLPEVIKALDEETKKAHPIVTRKVDTPICLFANVRYLYQPGELGGGGKRWATDPIWSVDVHQIDYSIITQDICIYYLKSPAPKRDFVKEELLIVPGDTVNSYMHMS